MTIVFLVFLLLTPAYYIYKIVNVILTSNDSCYIYIYIYIYIWLHLNWFCISRLLKTSHYTIHTQVAMAQVMMSIAVTTSWLQLPCLLPVSFADYFVLYNNPLLYRCHWTVDFCSNLHFCFFCRSKF